MLADTRDRAAALLSSLEHFPNDRQMAIAPSKCAAFEIVAASKSWHIRDPQITTKSGEKITFQGPTAPITYLGVQVSPWTGLTSEAAIEELRDSLHRVRKLALRPHQKIELLARYLIPHFLYPIAMDTIEATRLKELDRDVRMAVKDCLHLPASTADGFIYTAKRDGGLGFPRLESLVTATTLRAGRKFMNNEDPIMITLGPKSGVESRMKALAHLAHLGWPINNLAEINRYKVRLKAANTG